MSCGEEDRPGDLGGEGGVGFVTLGGEVSTGGEMWGGTEDLGFSGESRALRTEAAKEVGSSC